MTNEQPAPDIEAIKARLNAATPGKWHYWSPSEDEKFRVDIEGRWIAFKVWDEPDADLIANAPTDIATLLAENERLRAENERLQEELDEIDQLHWHNVELFERAAVADFEGVGTEED